MIDTSKEKVFWEIIDVLNRSGLLPHVMVIGSWAEYLYPHCIGEDYLPNLKTRDVDLYYGNPYLEVEGAEALVDNFRAANFILDEHFADTGKFFKEGIEVEFLSSQLGSGAGVVEIPFTGVKAEKLSNLEMLRPLWVEARGYGIKVPTPESYIAHKLYINPERRPISKRSKDIEAVRSLLLYLSRMPEAVESLRGHIASVPIEKRARIAEVAARNGLVVPGLD